MTLEEIKEKESLILSSKKVIKELSEKIKKDEKELNSELTKLNAVNLVTELKDAQYILILLHGEDYYEAYKLRNVWYDKDVNFLKYFCYISYDESIILYNQYAKHQINLNSHNEKYSNLKKINGIISKKVYDDTYKQQIQIITEKDWNEMISIAKDHAKILNEKYLYTEKMKELFNIK